jgi:phosphate transport system substrate-binding protein
MLANNLPISDRQILTQFPCRNYSLNSGIATMANSAQKSARQPFPAASFLLALTLGLGVSQVPQMHPQMAVVQAQEASPAPFPLPDAVPSDTQVKLDGSPSMSVINETFKQKFEGQFGGTQVNLTTSNSAEALQALRDGKIDVAAVGRPITDEEKAEGLKPLVLNREKIAIILGPDNPFKGDITFAQFAKIFRGEITDWSELGGAPGPIRFIDRPDNSDTRISLSKYKVFEAGAFQTGGTAKVVEKDDTAAVIQELGKDGIGYAIASHVLNNDKVRIVPMHKTLPDDPRYPYSQPRNYVYKAGADGKVSPAVQAFLGFAGAPIGQAAVKEAQAAEAAAAGAAVVGATAAGAAVSSPAPTDTASPATPDAGAVAQAPMGAPNSYTPETGGGMPWGWWLLPLAVLGTGGLLWWLKDRKGDAAPPVDTRELAGVGGGRTARAPEFTGTNPPNVGGAATTGRSTPAAGGSVSGAAATGNGTRGGAGAVAAGLGAAAAGAGLAGAAALANRAWNSRLTLAPRSSTEAEANWNWEGGHRDALKQQGGRKPMLRLYDVTGIDPDRQNPHSVRQYDCGETATNLRVPITTPDRDYVAELGYVTEDGRWLKGIRSNQIHIPAAPVSPTTTQSTTVTATPTTPTATTAPTPSTPPSTSPTPSTASGVAKAGLGTAAAVVGGAAIAAGAGAAALKGLATPKHRMGLKPFGERSVYASWDLPADSVASAKQQGGQTMQLRVYDTTGIDLAKQPPHNTQVFKCNESSHDKIVPVPHPGRDYVAEVGYETADERWLPLARSQSNQLVTGLAAAGATAAATAPLWGQGRQTANVEPQHPNTQRYTIDARTNSFVFTPEHQARLTQQTAATQTLEPGHYTLKIKDGTFSYRPLYDHAGEPWVIIWLKGQLTGLRTQKRVSSTWLTLNGYGDEYKFQVHEPTTLHAFFVDTNVPDNDGEVTLAVTKE